MKLSSSPSEILKSHFEKMKEVIPEVYEDKSPDETREAKLFALMKRTLSIIDAVYFQNRDMFTVARIEEYGKILEELKILGFDYHGNTELIEKAAAATIMNAKKPMEKAKGKTDKEESTKKAI